MSADDVAAWAVQSRAQEAAKVNRTWGADDAWRFAEQAVRIALDTIPDPASRREAEAELGWALWFARSLAPCDGDPVDPPLRAVTTR